MGELSVFRMSQMGVSENGVEWGLYGLSTIGERFSEAT